MKSTLFTSLRLMPVVLAIVLYSQTLNAQVNTRFLSSEEGLKEYLPWIFEEGPIPIVCDAPVLEPLLQAVANDQPVQKRMGLPQALMLTEADGEFYDFGSYLVWKLELSAEGAESINVLFTNVNLPERTQLVVYSRESAMFHGAVTSKDLVGGNYFADLMVGDQVTVEVVMPASAKEDFALTIPSIVYGIVDQSGLLKILDGNKEKVPVVTSDHR